MYFRYQGPSSDLALFLLDIKGRVLIWLDYRGDVSAAQAERFFTKFIEKEVVFLIFSGFDQVGINFSIELIVLTGKFWTFLFL